MYSHYRCICPLGFEGTRCEINADDCIGNRCQNNATCIDKIGSYECNCAGGFSGEFCQSKIPFCSTPEFSPCQNGGQCIDHFTHYTCECMPGFTGVNCTNNVNDCVDNMCQNGGTCIDGINEYTCRCPPEYSGKFCEIEPMVAQMYQQASPCAQHDCKHGICFQPPGSNDYICKCAPGYSGMVQNRLFIPYCLKITQQVSLYSLLLNNHQGKNFHYIHFYLITSKVKISVGLSKKFVK